MSMMFLPSVLATCRPKKAKAMKLKKAAHMTAYLGDSTRVATMVAIELAASWKPFRKSKNSARPTRAMMAISVLSMFHQDALDDLGHVLALVERAFRHIVDLLPLYHHDRVFLVLEEVADGLLAHRIAEVLHAVDLYAVVQHAAL